MVDVTSDENIIKANLVKTAEPIQATPTMTPSASEEVKGMIRIATEEEAIEGTSRNTAITPFTLNKATHYEHEQGVASDVWVIHHNLNKKPSIMVVDSADNVVEGAERYIDENTVEIRFNGSFKGKAYLN